MQRRKKNGSYEEEVLFRMYGEQIIGHRCSPIQRIATMIGWHDIVKKYGVKEKFPSVSDISLKKGTLMITGNEVKLDRSPD